MNVLFNELSYLHAPLDLTDESIVSLLSSLTEAIKFFRSITSLNQVVFWTSDPDIYHERSFLRGEQYRKLLGLVDSEQRSVLLSMFTKLNQLDIDGIAHVTQPVLNVATASVPAFLSTMKENHGMLSVFSHEIWYSSSVEFVGDHGSVSVANWPNIKFRNNVESYLESTTAFFLPLMAKIKPEEHVVLPYRNISNLLFVDAALEKYCRALPVGGRVAAYQAIGTAVAQINGYENRQDLNAINSSKDKKRNIFYRAPTDKYLSIDYEKGAFEYLNGDGTHLGEFSFQGRKLKERDENGGHDIKLN